MGARQAIGAWVSAVVTLLGVDVAHAQLTFGEAAVLNSNAATDEVPTGGDLSNDTEATIATDGAGTFVAGWLTKDPDLASVPSLAWEWVYERSTDGGRTWSAAQTLPASPYGWTESGVVGYGATGTWIAMRSYEPVSNRSVDGGESWGASGGPGGGPVFSYPYALDTDDAGTWIAVWSRHDGVVGASHLYLTRSLDDGLSWEPVATLGDLTEPEELGVSASYGVGELVTDRVGTWIYFLKNGQRGLYVTRSLDNGANWSSPVAVEAGYAGYVGTTRLGTDEAGTWVAAWTANELQHMVSRSTDNGLTWSAPVVVSGDLAQPYRYAHDLGDVLFVDGVWYVVAGAGWDDPSYGIGGDADLVAARSFDGGLTWTDVAALNVNAGRDNPAGGSGKNGDGLARIALGADGSAVMVWESRNSLGGTIGEDSDIFFARSEDHCPIVANPLCRTSLEPGTSSLAYKNPPGAKDKLQWSWRSGQATTSADFGTPTSSTDYAVCVYDKAGGSVRDVMELHALASTTCKKGPCWKATSSGWSYRDPEGRHGSVRSLQLVAGEDGLATIKLKAAGPAMAPPPMPLAVDPSVRVQLLNLESGLCWETTFSSPDTSTTMEFRALGD